MAPAWLRFEGHSRRQVLVLAGLICALLVAWPWLALFSRVGFTYAYWLRPEVHWALPGATGEAVVPKVMHQTWKTRDIPTKWAAARQSCIDLHPDWEHKLWTDADGERFIEVGGGEGGVGGGARRGWELLRGTV